MRLFRSALIAIPLALIAATVGTFIFFGLTGSQEGKNSAISVETTASAKVAGVRLILAVRSKQEHEFAFTLQFENDDGTIDATHLQPSVSKTMIGHDMGRAPVPMLRRSDGTWSGSGNFPMSGRWRFQIIFDGQIIEMDHTVR